MGHSNANTLALYLCAIVIAGLSLIGCSADTTQSGAVALGFEGTTKDSLSSQKVHGKVQSSAVSTAIDIKDEAGIVVGSLTLNDARVALREIEFDKETETEAEDAEDKAEFPGPYVVDLLTNAVSPTLSEALLPAGTYKEIELDLDKIEGDEQNADGGQLVNSADPLYGNSIYVEGTYTGPTASGNQVDVPFVMSFDLNEEFELTGPGDVSEGMKIKGNVSNAVLIAFRLQKWIDFSNPETNDKNLSPSQLTLSAGSIVLDENAVGDNKEIRKLVKENIKESADYGKDIDGDGKLGSDEDDDPDEEDSNDD